MIKYTKILFLLSIFSCIKKSDKKTIDNQNFFFYETSDFTGEDSVSIKYLKEEDVLIYKVKYSHADITKVKRINRDGSIEKFQYKSSVGNILGDYFKYNNRGKLIKYRYINPDSKKKEYIFKYDCLNGTATIEGEMLLESYISGDSTIIMLPDIHFCSYDVKITEISNKNGDNAQIKNGVTISNLTDSKFIYRQNEPKSNLNIDIYAKGLISDSIVHQNFKIVGESK